MSLDTLVHFFSKAIDMLRSVLARLKDDALKLREL